MRLLVFTRTTGYRHDSIPAGVAALRDFAPGLIATEDPGVFTRPLTFDAIVFLNTSGDVLTDAGRAALESYVTAGGGFVGIHCAAATETGWPFYQSLIGARFTGHPDIQPGRILVADSGHPATAGLPDPWPRIEEWYDFEAPATDRVLLRADTTSYQGSTLSGDHPLAWCHERHGGRAFYTALGHGVEAYTEPLIRDHLRGGITWAAGAATSSP